MTKVPQYYREEFKGWWANIYDPLIKILTFGFEQKIRESVFRYIPISPNKIVDFCCGTGSLTLLLHQHFPKAQISGIDLSEAMIKKAKKKCLICFIYLKI